MWVIVVFGDVFFVVCRIVVGCGECGGECVVCGVCCDVYVLWLDVGV